MPEPIAICIEDLDAQDPDDQYLRCVAVAGKRPGLGLSGAGEVIWERELDGPELWVSADDRLILFRPEGAEPIVVRRAGRSLAVPVGKPVVLLDQDELDIAERCYRVHVHGPAPAVHPPTPLRPRSLGAAATLAAAVAIGAPVAGCDKNPDGIEVRDAPPKVSEPIEPDTGDEEQPTADAAPTATATATATDTATATALSTTTATAVTSVAGPPTSTVPKQKPPAAKPTSPPIEVRPMPPFAEPPKPDERNSK